MQDRVQRATLTRSFKGTVGTECLARVSPRKDRRRGSGYSRYSDSFEGILLEEQSGELGQGILFF